MSFADHFSAQAETYAKFRPGYPNKLFEFPFGKIPSPEFFSEVNWDFEELKGFEPAFRKLWGEGKRQVKFPLHFHVGILQ